MIVNILLDVFIFIIKIPFQTLPSFMYDSIPIGWIRNYTGHWLLIPAVLSTFSIIAMTESGIFMYRVVLFLANKFRG